MRLLAADGGGAFSEIIVQYSSTASSCRPAPRVNETHGLRSSALNWRRDQHSRARPPKTFDEDFSGGRA